MADVNPAEVLAGPGTRYVVVHTTEEAIRLFPDRLYVVKACAEFFHGGCSAVVVEFTGRRKNSKYKVSRAASASDARTAITPETAAKYLSVINESLFGKKVT